jgi:hypothetical protein
MFEQKIYNVIYNSIYRGVFIVYQRKRSTIIIIDNLFTIYFSKMPF